MACCRRHVAGGAGPNAWVRIRQFTGRIATVGDAALLDDPACNHAGDFPGTWDEVVVSHALDPAAIDQGTARRLRQRFDLHPPIRDAGRCQRNGQTHVINPTPHPITSSDNGAPSRQ